MEDRTASSVHGISDREHRGSNWRDTDDDAREPKAVSSEAHAAYWHRRLDGSSPLQLPVDRQRVAGEPSSARTDRLQLRLPTALKKRLENVARQRHVSLFAVLCGSWAILLARWCTQEDVMIGARWTRRMPTGELTVEGLEALVPLRLAVDEAAPFDEFLGQVECTLTQTTDHTGMSMQHALAAHSVSEPPLLRAAISYSEVGPRAFLALTQEDAKSQPDSHELMLVLENLEGTLGVRLEYASDLFDRQTIRRMADSLKTLLQAVARHAGRPIGRLALLTGAERDQVLYRNNATAAHYPRERLIHELIEAQAERVPRAPALLCGNEALSYAQLNARANRLAHYLHQLGVTPRSRVALCLERGIEMGVAILGVLKAGAAYVPLDPNYPPERLAYLLGDATPGVVLTQSTLSTRLPPTQIPVLALDEIGEVISQQPDRNPTHPTLSAEDLAYVMYTSGSTGQPKGVMVRHRNVVNYASYAVDRFDIEQGEGSLIATSMNFDLALTGFYPPLICGRAVTFCAPDEDLSKALLSGRNYAPVKVTPTHLSILSIDPKQIAGRIRVLVVGGELLQAHALRWWREHSPGTRIFNHYGPTETTIGCVVHEIPASAEGPVPIGKPIANTQIYLLDAHRLPVPIGVVGEIYIGGEGVAAGYWNRPALTEEKFLLDPFSDDPTARMYKTGDLGRWRADGTIEYLGRNDDQVKIRGFRIELGEIAAKLREHALIKEAVVIAREDTPGDKRLVAYLTCAGSDTPSAQELRSHLVGALPDYMIPSAFVVMERLPLTNNAKLDRRALPAPDIEAFARQPFEAPQGEQEQVVATIWRDLFKTERIGRKDNFFELGGHSLLALQLLERARALGYRADARSLYQYPVLEAFARHLRAGAAGQVSIPPNRIPIECDWITPEMLPLIDLDVTALERIVRQVPGGARNVQDIYPLAPLQEGILFHHAYHPGADSYVLPTLFAIDTQDRLVSFIVALQRVVDRHDALRTAIVWENLPRPVQVVYRKAQLPVEEFVLDARRDIREQLETWMQPKRQRMDLDRAPLLRLYVAADPHSPRRYAILQTHHIISDHESTATLLLEVMTCLRGDDSPLPTPIPYREHLAHLLACAGRQDAETFFRSKLRDIDEPTAPFGLLDVHGERELLEAQEMLDAALAARVRSQARRFGVSSATLFHAAWALVTAAMSGREDVVFGTLLLGRMQGSAAAQGVVGLFINTLPLRLSLGSLSARELIERTHRELIELLSHEQASLAMAQRCSGIAGAAPLFTSLLNYVHGTLRHESMYRSMGSGVEILDRREWTNYPIVVSVEDRADAFVLSAQTDARVAASRMTAYLRTALASLAEALDQAPRTPALGLEVLPEVERRQVIHEFNATTRPYPAHRRIHELFEQQVARAPEAPAVIFEQQVLTYRELNAAANRLARYLRAQGVVPGEHVVILMERSVAQVTAQLAVLKCEAVYVPVDPTLPLQRQAFMVKDCGAHRVLIESSALAHDAFTSVQWISLEHALHSNLSADDGVLAGAAIHPAYVMYTSGSTGTPKGVVVPQHAVVRLIINNGYAELRSDDCIAYLSNPTFDAATFEVWGALLTGARLLIVPRAAVLDPQRLVQVLERERVSILWLTVGLFMQYADSLGPVFARARYVITGGDVVDPSVARRVLAASAPENLLNAYGPTECTTFTTTWRIERTHEPNTPIPIGRPMANASVYILNRQLQPVPIGAVGEIYIAGAGVALGYLNRPELTAQRFLPDPFSATAGARLYRSGDLGRFREDGRVEFVGRNDQQVKIRGFRIELGEIETRLSLHAQVKDALVIARGTGAGGKQLIAYVTASGRDAPHAEALRDHVSAALPEFMVPAAFIVLPSLPLTPNGKIDRRALPQPDVSSFVTREYEPPEGEIEEVLAGIWSDVLQVHRVGRYDNFFELGGHSLLAMQLMVRIRSTLSIEVRISEIFDQPSLCDFACRVSTLREEQWIERLERGGTDIDALLETVASMSEHEVDGMMSKLNVGARQ